MMINKRLIGSVKESRKYIAGNVICQWISLAANITMMAAIAKMLQSLFEGTAQDGQIGVTAAVAAVVVIVRFVCAILSSRMGYLSSKAVKKTLRELIYRKLLRLGVSYKEQVNTSEAVQVAVEGVDQLETYFGAYLPQFFYAMLAPLTLFVVLCFVNFPSAMVLLACVPMIPVTIVLIQRWAKRLLAKYWGQYTALGDTFLENLQGLTTTKIYQADEFKHQEMNEQSERFRKITMKVLTMQLNSITIMDLIAYGGAALGVILLALIRDKVFGALRCLCPAKLEGKDKGNLISIITSDIELLEVFYAHTISPICIAFLFTIVMVCFIGRYHIALGILALAAYVTVGVVIPMVTSKRSGDDGFRFRTKSGALSGFVVDSLRGLSETIQYGQGEKRMADMNAQSDSLSKDEERMKRTAGRNTAVTNTVILSFDLAMLFLSAALAGFEGCLTATLALMGSFGPVVALAALGATLQNTFAAGNRVLDILDESPVVEEITGKVEINFQGASAENVTFAYGEETILENFSVEIPENKIIGINGRSGSGKSTLLKLFMRFWQVQQGKVKLSGRNVDEINTVNLRDMQSFVTQETHLFHDSIRNNLRIAKLDATDEEIIAACKRASVHDFIMSLPKGYDTEVGELGDTLSGGERQRLGLARAFLHDAPLMLLDEPTSNLDSLNEAVILKSLHEERAGKTVVLVSHRRSTMGIADTVYSVEHGRMS